MRSNVEEMINESYLSKISFLLVRFISVEEKTRKGIRLQEKEKERKREEYDKNDQNTSRYNQLLFSTKSLDLVFNR